MKMHCGLMVRDGARAPPHHEGSGASRLSPGQLITGHAYKYGPEIQSTKQGAQADGAEGHRTPLITLLRTRLSCGAELTGIRERQCASGSGRIWTLKTFG